MCLVSVENGNVNLAERGKHRLDILRGSHGFRYWNNESVYERNYAKLYAATRLPKLETRRRDIGTRGNRGVRFSPSIREASVQQYL